MVTRIKQSTSLLILKIILVFADKKVHLIYQNIRPPYKPMKLLALCFLLFLAGSCASSNSMQTSSNTMKKTRYGKVHKYQLKTLKDHGVQRRHLFVN